MNRLAQDFAAMLVGENFPRRDAREVAPMLLAVVQKQAVMRNIVIRSTEWQHSFNTRALYRKTLTKRIAPKFQPKEE